MSIYESIQEAQKRGASADQILQEIQKQNPEKASVFQEAQKRGADSNIILNEIIKQNQPAPKPTSTTTPDFASGVGMGIAKTAFGASSLGEKIIKGAGRILTPKGLEDNLGFAKTPKTESEKIQGAIEQKTGISDGELFKPRNTAEKVGFGLEQVGEFLIPSSYVTKATQALKATSAGVKLAKGGRLAKVAGTAITRGVPEAVSAGAVTAIQEAGDLKDTAQNALIAGAIPIIGKGISVLKPSSSAVKSTLTGVPQDVFNRLKKMPEAYDDAVKYVTENEKQPFLGLANKISNNLKKAFATSTQNYVKGVDDLANKYPTKTFDLSQRVGSLQSLLKEKFNLTLSNVRDESGAATKALEVVKTAQTPYTNKELGYIDDLVNSVQESKKIGLRDVIDLRQKFDEAYNRMPFSPDGKPTKYHALVETLSSKVDEIVDDVVPELKPINQQYAEMRRVYAEFGKKFIDSTGQLSNQAEQYLSNIANLNKGAQRTALNKLEEATGLNILDNVIILKDAQALNHLFPQTGSRTLDIVRSLAISKGAGPAAAVGTSLVLGAPAAAAGVVGGALATSPKFVGKYSIEAAKLAKKFPELPSAVKTFLERISGK